MKAPNRHAFWDPLRPRFGRVVVGNLDFDQFHGEAVGVTERQHRLAKALDALVVVDAVVVEAVLPELQTPLGDAEGGP